MLGSEDFEECFVFFLGDVSHTLEGYRVCIYFLCRGTNCLSKRFYRLIWLILRLIIRNRLRGCFKVNLVNHFFYLLEL